MKTEKKPIVTEIYEALGEASMCWNPIPTGVFESSRAAEIGERLVKIVGEYTSQPMSAEPTVQQLREASKNNPDTFLAGALYVIDNYKLNSPSMSAEQYSSGAIHSIGKFPLSAMSAEQVEYKVGDKVEIIASINGHEFELGDIVFICDFDKESIECVNKKGKKWWVERSEIKPAPTVKAEGWVSVEEKQRLEQIIELKEKERQEWAKMCITKQKRIKELQAGYGDRLPDDYRYEEYGEAILKSISDTFLKNATKADRLSDTEVFQALGETILNFPLPPPPEVNINSVE